MTGLAAAEPPQRAEQLRGQVAEPGAQLEGLLVLADPPAPGIVLREQRQLGRAVGSPAQPRRRHELRIGLDRVGAGPPPPAARRQQLLPSCGWLGQALPRGPGPGKVGSVGSPLGETDTSLRSPLVETDIALRRVRRANDAVRRPGAARRLIIAAPLRRGREPLVCCRPAGGWRTPARGRLAHRGQPAAPFSRLAPWPRQCGPAGTPGMIGAFRCFEPVAPDQAKDRIQAVPRRRRRARRARQRRVDAPFPPS